MVTYRCLSGVGDVGKARDSYVPTTVLRVHKADGPEAETHPTRWPVHETAQRVHPSCLAGDHPDVSTHMFERLASIDNEDLVVDRIIEDWSGVTALSDSRGSGKGGKKFFLSRAFWPYVRSAPPRETAAATSR